MGIKDFHLKLKALGIRKFLIGDGGKNKKETKNEKRPSWMRPISHGYHVVEERLLRGESNDLDSDSDSVVVQREQIEEQELWFFGVFNARIAGGVTKYMQSNLFDKKPKQSLMKRKSKKSMKKAYLVAKAKIRETENKEETCRVDATSAIVIDGERLVLANMGEYKAVVCRDGKAYQISRRRHPTTKRYWSRKFMPGAIRRPEVRILAHESRNAVVTKPSRSSEPIIKSLRIDTDTEFVILASTGIWEVMKYQEAVNLIRHMEDPQEGAECLAKEALTRMSRRNISCLVIRFD